MKMFANHLCEYDIYGFGNLCCWHYSRAKYHKKSKIQMHQHLTGIIIMRIRVKFVQCIGHISNKRLIILLRWVTIHVIMEWSYLSQNKFLIIFRKCISKYHLIFGNCGGILYCSINLQGYVLPRNSWMTSIG